MALTPCSLDRLIRRAALRQLLRAEPLGRCAGSAHAPSSRGRCAYLNLTHHHSLQPRQHTLLSHASTSALLQGDSSASSPPPSQPNTMTTVSYACKTPEALSSFLAAAQDVAQALHEASIRLLPSPGCSPPVTNNDGTASSSSQPAAPPLAHPAASGPASPPNPGGPAISQFDSVSYLSHLRSRSLGQVLLSTADISSTQHFMHRHCASLGPGCVMVADRQSSGKGRGGNVWTSPPGCLMFSCCSRLQVLGAQAPFINYVVCLGVVQGIRDAVAAVAPALPPAALGIRIKWPNDLYSASGLKVGGVLINTTFSAGGFNVVSGVGLNLDNDQPTTCVNQLLGQALRGAGDGARAGDGVEAGAVTVSRELLLACIMLRLEACFAVFEAHGFGPLEEEYLGAWMHTGQRVQAQDPELHGAGSGAGLPPAVGGGLGEPVWLTLRGLSRQGFLLAEDDEGGAYELTPDGNSLDMMQGLIKRKQPA